MGTYRQDEMRLEREQAEGEAFENWCEHNGVEQDEPGAYDLFRADAEEAAEAAAEAEAERRAEDAWLEDRFEYDPGWD